VPPRRSVTWADARAVEGYVPRARAPEAAAAALQPRAPTETDGVGRGAAGAVAVDPSGLGMRAPAALADLGAAEGPPGANGHAARSEDPRSDAAHGRAMGGGPTPAAVPPEPGRAGGRAAAGAATAGGVAGGAPEGAGGGGAPRMEVAVAGRGGGGGAHDDADGAAPGTAEPALGGGGGAGAAGAGARAAAGAPVLVFEVQDPAGPLDAPEGALGAQFGELKVRTRQPSSAVRTPALLCAAAPGQLTRNIHFCSKCQ